MIIKLLLMILDMVQKILIIQNIFKKKSNNYINKPIKK